MRYSLEEGPSDLAKLCWMALSLDFTWKSGLQRFLGTDPYTLRLYGCILHRLALVGYAQAGSCLALATKSRVFLEATSFTTPEVRLFAQPPKRRPR